MSGTGARRPAGTSVRVIVRTVLGAMWVTLQNLFRTPVTVHYPEHPRTYPDRYRGLLALVYEKDTGEEACIGCRLCEYVCPPAVIKVEMLKSEKRNYAKSFSLELYACEFCELCVQVCPTDAIVMLRTFDLSTTDRRDLLLDKDRLHALGLQHEASWAKGTVLRTMQAPPKPVRPAAAPPAAQPVAAPPAAQPVAAPPAAQPVAAPPAAQPAAAPAAKAAEGHTPRPAAQPAAADSPALPPAAREGTPDRADAAPRLRDDPVPAGAAARARSEADEGTP